MRLKVEVIGDPKKYLQTKHKAILKAARYALGSTGKWLRHTVQRAQPKEPRLSPFTGTISSIRGRDGRAKEVKPFKGRGRKRWRQGGRMRKGDGAGYYPARRSTRTEPLTKMVGAVRTFANDQKLTLRVGFLRPGLWAMMTRMEEGFTVAVTPKMRKMLFSIGAPLGGKSVLTIPARPWITEVYKTRGKEIPIYYEAAFARKIREFAAL